MVHMYTIRNIANKQFISCIYDSEITYKNKTMVLVDIFVIMLIDYGFHN